MSVQNSRGLTQPKDWDARMPHDILIVLDSVVTCDLDIMLNKGIGTDEFNDGRKNSEFQLV